MATQIANRYAEIHTVISIFQFSCARPRQCAPPLSSAHRCSTRRSKKASREEKKAMYKSGSVICNQAGELLDLHLEVVIERLKVAPFRLHYAHHLTDVTRRLCEVFDPSKAYQLPCWNRHISAREKL